MCRKWENAMNNRPLKVLLIEDNPGDARLIHEMPADAGESRFNLHTATSTPSRWIGRVKGLHLVTSIID